MSTGTFHAYRAYRAAHSRKQGTFSCLSRFSCRARNALMILWYYISYIYHILYSTAFLTFFLAACLSRSARKA